MPNPTDYRFSVPLTNFLRNYKFELQTMVQDIVAPRKPRRNAKGEYMSLGTELWKIDVSDAKGPRSEPNEIAYDTSLTSFACDEYALAIFVSDKERREALSPWDPMRQAAITLRHALMLRKEKRVVDLAAATSNTTTPANDWDNALATIVADVNAGKAAMKAALGWKPNTVLWGDHISDEIVGQADIVDLIKYAAAMARPTSILDNLSSDDLPPRMFGMRRLEPSAQYDTAQPGATASVASIWGDDAYAFRVDNAAESPTWAITPESLGMSVRTVREEKRMGFTLIAGWEYDVIETTAAAVHKFVGVT